MPDTGSRAWHTDHLLLCHRVMMRATGTQWVIAGYRQTMEEIQGKLTAASRLLPHLSVTAGKLMFFFFMGSRGTAITGHLSFLVHLAEAGGSSLQPLPLPQTQSHPPRRALPLAAQVYTGMP